MKERNKMKKTVLPMALPGKPKRTRLWLVVVVVVLVMVSAAILFWPYSKPSPNATPSSQPTSENAGQEHLVGRWLRSDGTYVLEIRKALPDGLLEAAYYNPNPIHVGRARWEKKGGNLTVMVELRDVNYPGSTYTLTLAADNLAGNYYQAVNGVNYPVEFVRER
ncbi:MAG: hypothetical protein JNM57_07705 [Cyclobacteriaceae bacterium]|nr:hypothetical protein [Cyclobacteriaceae bacterium]